MGRSRATAPALASGRACVRRARESAHGSWLTGRDWAIAEGSSAWEWLRQHILCVGASGAGKTTLIGHVLAGVHGEGVGAVVVDLKGDPSLEAVARRVDRGAEVFRIDGRMAGTR